MTLLERIKNHPAVKDIEDDGGCCGYKHNWIVCLHDNWVDTENDCVGGLAEYTLREIWYRLTHYVKHFDTLTDPREIEIAKRALNR